MALKTFNLDQETYKQFSSHCKKNGISMSKKIDNFIKEELEKLKSTTQKSKYPPKKQPTPEEHSFRKYCY